MCGKKRFVWFVRRGFIYAATSRSRPKQRSLMHDASKGSHLDTNCTILAVPIFCTPYVLRYFNLQLKDIYTSVLAHP
jgi:hypothetical protein